MTQAACPPQAPSHRRILAIALPIVASNATIPLLGAVDTAVVGRLGAAAPIGAVGLGAVVLVTLYWVFGFLRMGTTGLTAQARGAGAAGEVAAALQRALLVALGAGLLLVALQGPLLAAAFRLAPASAEVEALARTYLRIRIWGAPATIALYAINGWLIGQERTRAVLGLQLLINGVNIGLDLLLVPGLGLGVPGVAAASLAAEVAGAGAGLWLCRAGLARAPGLFAPAPLREMARVNTDIMIRSVLLQAAFTSFVFLGAGMGDAVLAANQVLHQFLEITAYGLDGFAFAAEALVGQAMGAGAPAVLRAAALRCALWGALGAAGLAAAFALAGPALVDLMTTVPEVRALARDLLPWLVAAPLVGVGGWMLDGIFIGATLTAEMRRAMLCAVPVYGAALALLVPAFGAPGLWAALMVLYVARIVTLGALYPRVEAKAAR